MSLVIVFVFSPVFVPVSLKENFVPQACICKPRDIFIISPVLVSVSWWENFVPQARICEPRDIVFIILLSSCQSAGRRTLYHR